MWYKVYRIPDTLLVLFVMMYFQLLSEDASRAVQIISGLKMCLENIVYYLKNKNASVPRNSEWMKDFRNVTHIRVPEDDREVVNYVMFGELVTWFLGEVGAPRPLLYATPISMPIGSIPAIPILFLRLPGLPSNSRKSVNS